MLAEATTRASCWETRKPSTLAKAGQVLVAQLWRQGAKEPMAHQLQAKPMHLGVLM
jgi:hypothetical protein